jgi:hypothetical protein
MPHANRIAAMRRAIEAAGFGSCSIEPGLRRVYQAGMQTPTCPATPYMTPLSGEGSAFSF